MIEAGIFDGDFVIVSSRNEALSGEIIVAMIGDEVTVKSYENKSNKVRLIPQNKNYSPIHIDSKSDFSILGKVSVCN
ncbi:MAG: hypothetical protein MZV64_20400 [Ignavibacteriales bacterium]|nr:hypothetical protein [Ignavibacteriales bacterium]